MELYFAAIGATFLVVLFLGWINPKIEKALPEPQKQEQKKEHTPHFRILKK